MTQAPQTFSAREAVVAQKSVPLCERGQEGKKTLGWQTGDLLVTPATTLVGLFQFPHYKNGQVKPKEC